MEEEYHRYKIKVSSVIVGESQDFVCCTEQVKGTGPGVQVNQWFRTFEGEICGESM